MQADAKKFVPEGHFSKVLFFLKNLRFEFMTAFMCESLRALPLSGHLICVRIYYLPQAATAETFAKTSESH